MKFLLVLLALVSTSAFAYSPVSNLEVSTNNTVTLTVFGDEAGSASTCKYNITWIEGLTFKKYWGSFNLNAGEEKSFSVKNDIATKIKRARAQVECEYIDG